MQARNIYNDPKTLIQFYLKTGPHADTHTNEKEPRVLYWILTAEERDELGGQSPAGYLTVGGRACSAMRHLPKVVGLVPSRTCGTRGSWLSSGGE